MTILPRCNCSRCFPFSSDPAELLILFIIRMINIKYESRLWSNWLCLRQHKLHDNFIDACTISHPFITDNHTAKCNVEKNTVHCHLSVFDLKSKQFLSVAMYDLKMYAQKVTTCYLLSCCVPDQTVSST